MWETHQVHWFASLCGYLMRIPIHYDLQAPHLPPLRIAAYVNISTHSNRSTPTLLIKIPHNVSPPPNALPATMGPHNHQRFHHCLLQRRRTKALQAYLACPPQHIPPFLPASFPIICTPAWMLTASGAHLVCIMMWQRAMWLANELSGFLGVYERAQGADEEPAVKGI